MESRNGIGSVWRWRASRRGVLRAGGLAVAGAAALRCASPPSAPATTAAVSTPAAGNLAPPAAATTPTAVAKQPKYGGTLRSSGSVSNVHFDLHMTGGGAQSYNFAIAYSGLLKYNHGPDIKPPALLPVGDIAESWQQPDEVTYIFKLRPGVKFHHIAPVNGRELVADDFVFSFTRQRDLRATAAALSGITRMEAVDRSTFKVTLDQPNVDILVELASDACRVIAREVVDQFGDLKTAPVIGTGPWIFEKAEIGKFHHFTRNPDYFRKGLPYLDRLELDHLPDQATITSAFRSGTYDVIGPGMIPADYETVIKAVPQAKTHWILFNRSADEIGFNCTRPPFDDVRVRQAFIKALDFEQALEVVWAKRGELYGTIALPDQSWMLPQDELKRLLKRDPEASRRLLREAGYERGFDTEVIIVPTIISGGYIPMAELFQQQLKEVGINLAIKPIDIATYFGAALPRSEFQVYLGNQAARPSTNADLLGRFHSKGAQNYTKHNDPKLDELIEKQIPLGRDPQARRRALEELQRYVIDRAYKVGVCAGQQPTMYHPYVQNYYPATLVSIAGDFWTDVWFDK